MSIESRRVAWMKARRILCIRPDGLAGLLLSTPALRALRNGAPTRRLTLLGPPSATAALPFVPELDDALHEGAPSAQVKALAARRFDAAVVFAGHAHDALPAARLCRDAGIPLRLAHARADPDGALTDRVPEREPATLIRHEVQRQLALVRHVGCAPADTSLSFVPRPADLAAQYARLRDAGVDADRPWLLLHPGAGPPAHRYPPGHWAELLRLLSRDPGLPLVLTGSAAEVPLVDAIRTRAGVPAVALAGRTTLDEFGAAIALAAVVVGGSAAPVHIAAAVGTPVVDLHALTQPQTTPWKVPNRVLFHDVACRFCGQDICPQAHHGCLAGVAPARVAAAVADLLDHQEKSSMRASLASLSRCSRRSRRHA